MRTGMLGAWPSDGWRHNRPRCRTRSALFYVEIFYMFAEARRPSWEEFILDAGVPGWFTRPMYVWPSAAQNLGGGRLPAGLISIIVGPLLRLFVLVDQDAAEQPDTGANRCTRCRVAGNGTDQGATAGTHGSARQGALLPRGHIGAGADTNPDDQDNGTVCMSHGSVLANAKRRAHC